MRVDLRVKHDIEARKAAIELFERGHGSRSASKALSVPRGTVRQWLYVYRSFGSEVLLSMDGKQARYAYEQKVAAASAVVDGGMGRRDAMEAFGMLASIYFSPVGTAVGILDQIGTGRKPHVQR